MKGLRNGVIIVGLCFLADRIAASTVQIGKGSSEDKLQRLKEDLKYYNEYQERKSSQKYTMLWITGEHFSFQKICQIYDESIEKDDPNKMLSVISLINMNGNEPYDPTWFMQRFIKNMQECFNQGKNHILRDGMSLNIDFIKRKYINDFDQVKSKLELICDIYRRFEESMMDHFYDICLDALKSIMYDSIRKRMQENVEYRSLQKRIDENRMDDFCKGELELIIQMVETSDFWYEIKHTSAWDFDAKESAYYMLYIKALRYEEELRFYYSSLYMSDLHAIYTYIIHKKYKKLFLGGIKEVFEKCLPVFKKQVNQKSFSKYYTAICKHLVIFLKKSRLSENYDFSCRISGFFRTKNFTANIQSWFTDLVPNDLKKKHCEKYIVSLDKMRTKPRSWYTTKLVYNGQIDKVKMHLLCDILYHNMTFDRLHKHQSIYIDHEKGMSKNIAAVRTKDLGKEIKKFTANAKTLHFSTVIEPLHESPKHTPQKIFTYTEVITDTNDKFDQSCVELRRKNEEKKITFGRYDETEMQNSESTQHLITMCVTNNNSTPVDTSIVKIVTNDTFSYIVIFQHRAKKSKRRKIVSLIFNMHSLGPSITNVIEKDQGRRIRCLDNVPLLFQNNFFNFLEYLELSDSISFELPNILHLSTIDLIYTEHIVCMDESENEFRLHRKLSDVYKPDYLRTETFCLSAEKILNFERVQSHNHEKLKMCIKDIGVTENEFNEILKEVIFNKRIINVHNITGSINSAQFQSSKFDIYITHHKGDNKLLHILESSGGCFMHNMAVNPIKDISFIFGLEEKYTALQKLNCVAKCLDGNVSFLALVTIEICKHMKYTSKSHPSGSRGLNRSQFRTIIYQNIGKVFKRIKYCSEDIKNPKRVYFAEIYKTLPDIQAEIVPEDLEELAEILFIKSNTIPIEKRYKAVYIKIKRRTDDNETITNTTYQYENVRRWW